MNLENELSEVREEMKKRDTEAQTYKDLLNKYKEQYEGNLLSIKRDAED